MPGVFFGLSASLLYGLSTVAARMKVERDKVGIAVLYTLFTNNLFYIAIILFKIVILNGEFIVDFYSYRFFALSGLFGPFLGRTLLFASSERIGASKATSIKILSPVFSAVIALIFLQEIIPWVGYVGIAIVVYGLYWLQKDSQDYIKGTGQEENSNIKIGSIMAFGCALFYSFSYVFRKSGITIYPYPLEAAFIEVFFALLYYLIYFLVTGKLRYVAQVSIDRVSYFVFSGVAASCAIFSYYYALQFLPATIAATLISTQVFFVIIIGVIQKGFIEMLTPKIVVGSILIFIGVTLTVMF
jgi:drug/metabolite transporter (DMT)-like permease